MTIYTPGPTGNTYTFATNAANAAELQPNYITDPPAVIGEPPHVCGVDALNRLTITSAATGSDTNRREVWLLPGTYTDVEIQATAWGTYPLQTVGGISLPQVGLMARIADNHDGTTSAVVLDSNITFYSFQEWFNALWQWNTGGNPSNLIIGSKVGNVMVPRKSVPIIYAQRQSNGSGGWNDLLYVQNPSYNWTVGMTLDVVCSNTAYNQSNVAITAIAARGPLDTTVAITVPSPTGSSAAIAQAAVSGLINLDAANNTALAYYPIRMSLQIIGNVVSTRVWQLEPQSDPGYDATQGLRIDHSGENDGSGHNLTLPSAGRVGLICNHLESGGNKVTYSDITVTRLD